MYFACINREAPVRLERSSAMRTFLTLGAALLGTAILGACAASETSRAPAHPAAEAPPLPPFREEPVLAAALDEAHVAGAFAYAPLGKSQTEMAGSNRASCMERRSPASTFKVPHALFALDRGVITPSTTFPGVDVPAYPAWRETLDVKGALAASSVPWFQQVATKLGFAGEQELVDSFDYGDRQIGADLTHFWLGAKGAAPLPGPPSLATPPPGNSSAVANGRALHISPAEQVRFLDRLVSKGLPLRHPESADVLLALLPEERVAGRIVRGKTGWAVSDDGQTRAAWYIGIVLAEGDKPGTAFALVLDAPKRSDQRVPTIEQRKPLAFALLTRAGRL